MLFLLACTPDDVSLGNLGLRVTDSATVEVLRGEKVVLTVTDIGFGVGEGEVQFTQGAYLFEDVTPTWTTVAALDVDTSRDDTIFVVDLLDSTEAIVGSLTAFSLGPDELVLRVGSTQAATDQLRLGFDCRADDAFLGTGEHAFDVEHRGEAYRLWVSEPGVGKRDDDEPSDAWFIEGTRHSTSYPDPFIVLPNRAVGVSVQTNSRVDVDFCKTDPARWHTTVWGKTRDFIVWTGPSALDVVSAHALRSGPASVPPDWAFAAWNDAIRGVDRVMEVATLLRDAGAPSSVIWTEDWMGGVETPVGYHPRGEWDVDTTLYPNPENINAELESLGFKWLAYFAPFLRQGSRAAAEAEAFAIEDDAGETYWFLGYTLEQMTVLDLTKEEARSWAVGKMDDAVAVGFDGWMADFGEWVPTDASFEGMDALLDHNAYPLYWQTVNAEALGSADSVYFSRSGWDGSTRLSPVHWAGDQRTSFDADDGLPTVVPMGIGAGIAGVSMFTHDIGGYQSAGNPPSTTELWFRWCTLGAFTPVMRTHHGAYSDEDWQFDTDEETLAHFARYAREHARLFPYLRAMAERASQVGTPIILHPALVYDGVPWSNIDTWLLGSAMLVAPVLTEGATGRDLSLPDGIWFDWWTGERASGGWVDAAVDEIPVFVADGTLIPTLTTLPDTFADASAPGVTDLADVDNARTLRVFGKGGAFTEADGTRYEVSGTASAAGSSTDTVNSGAITVNGLTVTITGSATRSYTVEVWP